MSWSASVLSTISSDTEPTIVLTFENAKYIFNVGENTTRAFLQSRRNWKKTRGIFLTSVGTERASGLSGLLMTFADSGISDVSVVGPYGLLHFLASMRKYTFRDNMAVTPIEVPLSTSSKASGPSPIYEDENISVFAIPIVPNRLSASSIQPKLEGVVTSGPDEPVTPPKTSVKRRRTPSPTWSTQRISRSSSFSISSSDPETLQELMRQPDFAPRNLRGELAQAWRRLIARTMFPSTQVRSQAKRRKKGTSDPLETSDPITQKQPEIVHISHPPGFNQRLPGLDSNLLNPADASLRPVLAYAVVGPRVRGKFDVERAAALGLNAGPLRRKVAKGEIVTIMADDGHGNMTERIIRPEDCLGPSENPGVVLLLDTPTLQHIPLLLSSFNEQYFSRFRSGTEAGAKDLTVRTVFHICGRNVLEDERYRDFMNGFGSDVQHIVASREHSQDPITFTSAAYSQLRLNQLDADMFPLPKFSLYAPKDIHSIAGLPQNTTAMQSGILVNIRPFNPPVQEQSVVKYDLFHPAVSSPTPLSLPEVVLARFAEARALVQNTIVADKVPKHPGADVTIVPLGTGSAMPNKYRNVSGTLLQIPTWGNVLLDAGEGTWGQLVRHFGLDSSSSYNVWDALRDLKCIFISHIHGDHHIGLAKILAMRQQLTDKPSGPLYLVANYHVFLYLREYAVIEDLGFQNASPAGVITIRSEALHWRHTGTPAGNQDSENEQEDRVIENLHATLGLQSLTTVDVEHRIKCHGLIMKHKAGWSIVFSGDTLPTDKLVQAGTDATLLIHEATMADDQVEMAKAKMHSTFGQALEIGKNMNAANILLTHFSARYPKMPPLVQGTSDGHQENPIVTLAFDHLNLKMSDTWKMNAYLPAIEQSFIDTADEGDGENPLHTTQVDIV